MLHIVQPFQVKFTFSVVFRKVDVQFAFFGLKQLRIFDAPHGRILQNSVVQCCEHTSYVCFGQSRDCRKIPQGIPAAFHFCPWRIIQETVNEDRALRGLGLVFLAELLRTAVEPKGHDASTVCPRNVAVLFQDVQCGGNLAFRLRTGNTALDIRG